MADLEQHFEGAMPRMVPGSKIVGQPNTVDIDELLAQRNPPPPPSRLQLLEDYGKNVIGRLKQKAYEKLLGPQRKELTLSVEPEYKPDKFNPDPRWMHSQEYYDMFKPIPGVSQEELDRGSYNKAPLPAYVDPDEVKALQYQAEHPDEIVIYGRQKDIGWQPGQRRVRRATGLQNTGRANLPTSRMGSNLPTGNPGTNLPINEPDNTEMPEFDPRMRYRRLGVPFQFDREDM